MNIGYDLIQNGIVTNGKGETFKLHSNTSLNQCLAMQKCINEINIPLTNTIEIGLAYGISSLFICEALQKKNLGYKHHIMDPMQKDWGEAGLHNLKKAGYFENIEFHEEYSYKQLPQFLKANKKFQFAYIDSTKLFDYLLVDFFYLDKITDTGAVVIFDDCNFSAIRKLVRMISQLPNWEIVFQFEKNPINSISKKIITSYNIFKLFPAKFKSLIQYATNYERGMKKIKQYILPADDSFGINYHSIGFRKVGNDERHYDWFKDF